MNKILDRISGPEDVKKLSSKELSKLASEIRALILDTISKTGGHLSPNLGVVEITLAMNYVFDPPHDKFIWDVGVISGLGILVTGLFIFSVNIVTFFLPKSSDVTPIAITPVIPGITVSFASLPYFLVAIMIGAIVHEFGH